MKENKLDRALFGMDEWVMWDKLYINERYIIKYFFHPVHRYQHLKNEQNISFFIERFVKLPSGSISCVIP